MSAIIVSIVLFNCAHRWEGTRTLDRIRTYTNGIKTHGAANYTTSINASMGGFEPPTSPRVAISRVLYPR